MKYHVLAVLFLIPFIHYGQIRIQNHSLTDPEANFIYIGIDNKVQISGLKNYAGTHLSISNNTYELDQNGNVIIRVNRVGREWIKLYKGSELLVSKEYNMNLIPEARVKLGGYSDTAITFNHIKANNKLTVVYPGCVAKLICPIISFEAEITQKDGTIIGSFPVKGDQLPADILELIKNLQSGDKLRFHNIRALGADDERFRSFFVNIK